MHVLAQDCAAYLVNVGDSKLGMNKKLQCTKIIKPHGRLLLYAQQSQRFNPCDKLAVMVKESI